MNACMKTIVFASLLASAVACESAATPPATPAAPDPSVMPTPDTRPPSPSGCEAASGKCVPVTATVACKTQPVGLCGADEICCVM